MTQEHLLGMSEASELLGVSEAALRQWTDEGEIKAFITPGGHRRYMRAELKKFMSSQRRVLGVKDLAIELEGTAQQHREIALESIKKTAWYDRLNEESQEHLADLGRQMLKLIIKYFTDPSRREETILLVRDVGHEHGKTLAKLELPLTDSVEAFLLHRDPIMNAVTHLLRKREAYSGRIVKAIPMVAHVLDQALVALVAAHQQYCNGIQKNSTGGISA